MDADAGVARLEALGEWPDDPRRDRWVVDALDALPHTSRASEKWWRRLFRLVTRIRDRSLAERLAAWPARARANVGGGMADWLVARHEAAMRRLDLAPDRPLSDEMRSALASLGAAPRPEAARREGVLEELLGRVLDNPGDDAARLIYADALLEAGDPRGDFIRLQFKKLERGATTAEERQRERELLKQHRDAWLGPLAAVVRATGLKFQRGFLSHCRVHGDISAVSEHPFWRTVVHADAPASLLGSPAMAGLRSAIARTDAIDVLDGPTERAITSLCYLGPRIQPIDSAGATRSLWGPAPAEVAALNRLRALPQLQDLKLAMGHNPHLRSEPEHWFALLDGERLPQLQRLVLGMADDDDLGPWLTAILERGLAIPRIELRTHDRSGAWGDLRYIFEPDAALTVRMPRRADAEWHEHYENVACRALAHVGKKQLSALTIDGRWSPGRKLRFGVKRFRKAVVTLPVGSV